MKFHFKKQILIVALSTFSTLTLASEYRSELMALAEQFESSDLETQYAARRGLEVLVAKASAPDVSRGVSKINGDLLYGLRSSSVSREAKKYMLRQLALVGSTQAISSLNRIMLGDDDLLSENARKALESIEGPRATSTLIRAFAKADVAGQKDLIRSLGKRGDAASIGFFGKNLGNSNLDIAIDAAQALGRAGGERAEGLLISQYGKTSNKSLIQAIERSILASGSENSTTLKTVFENGSDVVVRRAALRRLLKQGGSGVLEALRSGLTDEDSDMRSIAIRAGLASDEKSFRDVVVERSKNMENADLEVLLSGLDSIDKEPAERIAISAFDSGDEGLQGLALKALGHCGSSLSIDLLISAYGKGNKVLRIQAASSIGRLQSDKMDERLASMLRSDSNDEVETALELLAHRNIPEAKSLLLGLVAGDDEALVKSALKALPPIASENDLERLLEIANSSEGNSRRLMISLLKKLAPMVGSESLQSQVKEL
jgi:HEAT repeat protein